MTITTLTGKGRRFRRPFLFAAALLAASCATAPRTSFDASKLQAIDAAIEEAVAQKRIPGGVLWVERDGETYRKAYGNRSLVPAVEPMTEDTIFDAASITKVTATAPSVWLLIERGRIALDAPVKTYLPEFTGDWRDEVTVRHLLTHTSGLRPSLSLAEPWSGYDEGIRQAVAESPRNRPGAIFRYSDVNFILLGEIVRRVSGETLDVFAEKNIFRPLGMRDTFFTPLPAVSTRIAPTEEVRGEGILRGVVHDPTSRRMGGVAGHAGLFTTAADLARYARMLSGAETRVMRPETVKAMTSVQSPQNVTGRRAGGFDFDTSYSRPRGERFAVGGFGHTGWTGGFLWIDPPSKSFYVFLSNRVHPDGKGSVLTLQKSLGTLVAEAVAVDAAPMAKPARYPTVIRWVTGGADVQNGIDVLHVSGYEALRGLRVGLITNHTGIDRSGNPTIDLLRSAPDVKLVALFSPEHGIRGVADAKIGDEVDTASGLPVYSLYGDRRKPSAEQLAGLDALVFDIQDIGARFYTYISTMGMAMEAAAEAKVKMIVLDRANPIGGEVVEGPLRDGEESFIAWHPIVVRHGMTVGELAKMFREERKIDVDLTVIALRGWKRPMYQDEAGLPWINTSPNMRSLEAATLYPGIGILERAISVGRGTPTPFEILGAPFIDGEVLARELRALALPGIEVTPVRFTPDASVHQGEECGGLRLRITDRRALRPVDLGIAIAMILQRLYPDKFDLEKTAHLLRHPPTLEAIRAGKSLEEIHALWKPELQAFEERRKQYLMY